ncbi:hypothetical protein AOLI_G00033530, partial [Acnodon oligacanthus]
MNRSSTLRVSVPPCRCPHHLSHHACSEQAQRSKTALGWE